MPRKTRKQIEFGDFQTPEALARAATEVVAARGVKPLSIVEPTCGIGSFLFAALDRFPSSREAVGVEVNPGYFQTVHDKLLNVVPPQNVDLQCADFFSFDWLRVFDQLPDPILVIGNPPWVTASELGSLQSKNLPTKSNFQKHRGFDAVTGKSNFDIAEWMVTHLMERLSKRQATVAMLLKTTVARKVLFNAWKAGLPLANAGMYLINAREHFDVSVDACLLVCEIRPGPTMPRCEVFDIDAPGHIDHVIAFRDGLVLAGEEAFKRHSHLLQDKAAKPPYRWRSGIKHDCSRVMELRRSGLGLLNGFDEVVDLEPDYLYPMLKGSDVAKGGSTVGKRYMIVTQKKTGQPTSHIKTTAPKTWAYLCKYGDVLDRRSSSIYRNSARFSIFGVGPYTFMPWKVAICGLYKRLGFSVIGPHNGKPVVLDDIVYHLSCKTEEEARILGGLLGSATAGDFYSAFIFWDAKRPITAEILGRLDLLALADETDRMKELLALRPDIAESVMTSRGLPGNLFQNNRVSHELQRLGVRPTDG